MGKPRGKRDYSNEIKVEAVQCFLAHISDADKVASQRLNALRDSNSGRRDLHLTTFQKAHETLKHRIFENPEDAVRVNAMTSRQFRRLVQRHASGVLKKGAAYRRLRTRPPGPLSEAELREAARCLGTPINDKHGYRFHRTAADAYQDCTRFAELCSLSKLQPEGFGRKLLAQFPDILCRGKLDQRESLSAKAREERTEAAEIWGGRKPWRQSKHPSKRESGPRRGVRSVYWDAGSQVSHQKRWPYFNKYTFLMDAGTVSTGDPVITRKGDVGFFRVDEIFPPEEVRASAPVGAQLQLMFYIVIHRTLGIVVGPEFMYTGSRSSTSKRRKHVPSFMCWCSSCPLVYIKTIIQLMI